MPDRVPKQAVDSSADGGSKAAGNLSEPMDGAMPMRQEPEATAKALNPRPAGDTSHPATAGIGVDHAPAGALHNGGHPSAANPLQMTNIPQPQVHSVPGLSSFSSGTTVPALQATAAASLPQLQPGSAPAPPAGQPPSLPRTLAPSSAAPTPQGQGLQYR